MTDTSKRISYQACQPMPGIACPWPPSRGPWHPHTNSRLFPCRRPAICPNLREMTSWVGIWGVGSYTRRLAAIGLVRVRGSRAYPMGPERWWATCESRYSWKQGGRSDDWPGEGYVGSWILCSAFDEEWMRIDCASRSLQSAPSIQSWVRYWCNRGWSGQEAR
jgi:hypothetical protein